MHENGAKPNVSNYAAWLANVRQASAEQRVVQALFSEDGTSVSFDTVSFATFKTLPDRGTGQE
ncbi:hypothetical protein [Arsukibacterium indicum]|uniref:Uncharacterized protein n=1 Tax=Arsukibacterium indicum TaxID=2848612 RepID=A0ABS6ML03_9GAMM|nr:hypothetical protein [Arsukibacterium indicum]MBV2129507.1 hypothetical protein [Arsukibacterium indicum]